MSSCFSQKLGYGFFEQYFNLPANSLNYTIQSIFIVSMKRQAWLPPCSDRHLSERFRRQPHHQQGHTINEQADTNQQANEPQGGKGPTDKKYRGQ